MPIEDLAPACPLMRIAWIDALHWAMKDENCIDSFTHATGMKYSPPRNGFEAMIDDATGHSAAFVEAFVKWFNESVWGDLNIESGQ